MERLTLLSICTAVALFGAAVAAEEPDAEEEAKRLYAEASDLFTDGDFAQAAALFRQAHQAKPSWKIQYNIGQAESAARRYGLALEAFELYLAEGGDEIPEERLTEVMEEVRRLRDLVGSVNVEAPDGHQVFIDGILRGTTPLVGVIKVAAGTRHEVEIRSVDTVVLTKIIRLSGGDDTTITVEADKPDAPLAPTPAAPAAASPVPPSPSPAASDGKKGLGLRVSGGILLGVGVATAAVGGVFGGIAISKTGELEDLCPDMTCSSDIAIATQDDAWTFGVLSNVFISVGAGLAAGGLVLLIVGVKKKKSATRDTAMLPLAGPQFTGLVLERRF